MANEPEQTQEVEALRAEVAQLRAELAERRRAAEYDAGTIVALRAMWEEARRSARPVAPIDWNAIAYKGGNA